MLRVEHAPAAGLPVLQQDGGGLEPLLGDGQPLGRDLVSFRRLQEFAVGVPDFHPDRIGQIVVGALPLLQGEQGLAVIMLLGDAIERQVQDRPDPDSPVALGVGIYLGLQPQVGPELVGRHVDRPLRIEDRIGVIGHVQPVTQGRVERFVERQMRSRKPVLPQSIQQAHIELELGGQRQAPAVSLS